MTIDVWSTLGAFCASLLAMLFSTLTYSLRDFSRAKLAEALNRRGEQHLYELLLERANDLIFTTAVGRLLANLLVLIFILELSANPEWNKWFHYGIAVGATAVICGACSVAIPHALSRHAAEAIIASHARFLMGWRVLLLPLTRLMNGVDAIVGRLAGGSRTRGDEQTEKHDEIEQEILSAVEEGEKEGVVDETEREMITSVIEFGDTTVSQIMTARTEIIALPIDSSLQSVKLALAESGHSRIPLYEATLDRIVGVLYARDLLKYVGAPAERFDIRSVMRQPLYVPKTKILRDLLSDFRVQKIHIAIVLDEYGGTAGLLTIEDIMEELVGDISDEHEPLEQALFKRLTDQSADADARIYIDELNRQFGLNLPEDAGFDTLGGFITTTIGRIPPTGTVIEHAFVRYTILDAEPQKVNRVRIDLMPQPAEAPTSI
ncbi:MAG TPA: hemolysin family protein [Tepidisphaeraceae bacterium]|nr:hemolysin family protein [Tepidisphaeraceae bacterium]